jgi:hypothetical protein
MALVLTAVLAMAATPVWATEATTATAAPPVAAKPEPGKVIPADPKPAGTAKAEPKKPDPVVEELRDKDGNPHIAKVEQKARELIAPLTQPQMQDLYLLREGFGLIRSVEIVQRDIGRAVRLCGEDNPDLKGPMEARYKKWTGKVDPVLKSKMTALQKAIDTQTYTQPAKIRSYFKSLDDAAIYAEKKFDKRVITTEEACKSLLQSMDGTEENVAGIMSELKVPGEKKAAPQDESKDEPAKKAE